MIRPSRPSRGAPFARARRSKARTEGAALFVVMLIIVVSTALAAVSVRNTTSEARAIGRELMIVHARYAAEAALATTIAWFDIIGNTPTFLQLWEAWGAMPPPDMTGFTGGHVIANNASRHMAARTVQAQQMALGPTVLPISDANAGAAIPDVTGSFGPNQRYVAMPYAVDITDCSLAPATLSQGNQVNASASGQTPRQFYCVLTARGRLVIPNAQGRNMTWTVGPNVPILQERSGVAHDARASILTPSVLMPTP